MQFHKGVILCLVIGCLAACHTERQAYVDYYQHPEKLKQTLRQCYLDRVTSRTCLQAKLASEVLHDFIQLTKKESQPVRLTKQKLDRLKTEWDNSSGSFALEQQIRDQQGLLMEQVEALQFSVQENFAKLIMQQETILAELKQQRKADGTNQTVTQQIHRTEQKIKAMYAFVSMGMSLQ